MPNFTKEQLEVINETGKNITVSASAGSGKTTVLVARIMKRVLEDKVPLDRILAMTFTEAAAAEMKQRLAKELNEQLTKGIYDPSIINEQLIKLQNAQISTIDSFCLKIIKENYAQIGFAIERCDNIIMEEEAIRYKEEAMETVINEYQSNPSFIRLRTYMSSKAYDSSELENVIRRLSNIFEDETYNEVMATVQSVYTSNHLSTLPDKTKELLINYLVGSIRLLQSNLTSLDNSLVNEEDSKKYEKCHTAIDLKQRKLDLCHTYINDSEFSYAAFKQAFINAVETPLEANTKNTYYSNLRKDIQKAEDTFLNELYDENIILNDLHEDYAIVHLLLDMSYSYLECFRAIKAREAVMDFSDMEHYALEILETSSDVRNHYKDLFIDIMVDEFQDSSYMQDKMLSLISNGSNIFRVGDVKQSIYGFRKAVPDLLKNYIEHPTENDRVIFLQHNFRSNEQIITYVNALFEPFMNQPGLHRGFESNDIAFVGSDDQKCDKTCIEYHSLITDLSETEEDDDSTKNELRANYIANLIASDKINTPDSKWSDYVILLRSHTNKKILKDAFESRNIPYFMDTKEGFYKSSAITSITSFLHAIIEPHVDIYFLAVAASSFYRQDDDAIAKAYLAKKEGNYRSFYAYALESNDSVFSQIAEDIASLIKLPTIHDKLKYIYQISDFYEQHCTIQERNNLDFLLEKTNAFEAKYPNALHKFLNTIEQNEDSKGSEALSHNTDEDVVTVMTIHQSKGLQFKKVIYWGKESTGMDHNGNSIYDTSSSLVMHHIDEKTRIRRNSLLHSAVSFKNQLNEVEEEIRLIYVALTRAVEKLYLVAIRTNSQHERLSNYPLGISDLINKQKYIDYIYHLSRSFPSQLIAFKTLDVRGENLILEKKKHPLVTYERLPDVPHQPIQFVASNHEIELYEWNDSDINYADIGTLTHSILETIDIHTNYTIQDIKNIATSLNSELADKVYFKSILAYLNHPFTIKLQDYTITHELPFITKQNNQMSKGYMDMVAENDNEIIIIDFKTDRDTTQEELKTRYENQLSVYKNALRNSSSKKVTAYIYSLSLEDYIEV